MHVDGPVVAPTVLSKVLYSLVGVDAPTRVVGGLACRAQERCFFPLEGEPHQIVTPVLYSDVLLNGTPGADGQVDLTRYRADRLYRGEEALPQGGGLCVSDSILVVTPLDNDTGDATLLHPPAGACVCFDGWAGATCDHPRGIWTSALTLSVILGMFGADRFYLGYYAIGMVKLMVTASLCYLPMLPLLFKWCVRDPSGEHVSSAGAFILACTCTTVLTWWAVDIALLASGDLNDFEGYALVESL
eukprot:CAMPEP_0170745402 /NCGR_PEP_ID=MMETSP0437-20130122/8275_1 /TAXON_ID=0 /ORGANISM="Sexangularia sp." /LENGTH=244 /DNA_ID=CAMNT_0011084121 /DNA_START=191 /DNA_END=925 /DNA_ORIENTATION=-